MSTNTRLLVAMVLLVSVVTSAQAEPQRTVSTLTELGRAPFAGSSEQACQLLKEYDVSYMACISALSTCDAAESMYLEDGTLLVTTTTTKRGEHKAVTVELQLKYPPGHELAGQSLPADHPDRAARVCKQISADGVTFVIPDACDNPSLAFLPPPLTPEVPEEKEEPPPPPKKTVRWVCDTEYFSHFGGGWHVHTPGVTVKGCPDSFVGGHSYDMSSPIQSNGGSDGNCRWVSIEEE